MNLNTRARQLILLFMLLLGLAGCTTDAQLKNALEVPESSLIHSLKPQRGPVPAGAKLEKKEETAAAVDDDHPALALLFERKEEEENPFNAAVFADIYDKVNGSVVNIQVSRTLEVPVESQSIQPFYPEMPGLPNFPHFQIPSFPDIQPMPQQGQGSGFVYDAAGHIITNHHVVADAEQIRVVFVDGTEVEASLVGADPSSDLAVLRLDDVDENLLNPVTLAEDDVLRVGEMVVAIGNPYGLVGSMTTGIVSGLGRILPSSATQFSIPDMIQTDAAINPGNSGGPLLNLDGEVIGVNTAIFSPNRAFAGVGYAIPVHTVRDVVPALIENGRIDHPWLGIAGRTLDRDTALAMNLDPKQRGVLIADVVANGPAFAGQLRGSDVQLDANDPINRVGGDIIIAINKQPVNDFDDLLSYILHKTEVGETITLEILRDGNPMEVEITLAARPGEGE